MPEPHEDPETEYERMLERMGLDCSEYGCWQPIVGYVLHPRWGDENGYCQKHIQGRAVVRWLES